MARDISNSADILDSRDIIARIEELQGERESIAEEWANRAEFPDPTRANPELLTLEEWDADDEGQELKALLALQEEASGSPDWVHGEALIRDSYFEDYARDLAEDIGSIDKNATWPSNHIDWEAATDALKQDYMSVDFDGVEYWIRA